MAHLLAQSLENPRPGIVPARLKGKVGKHAGVPCPAALSFPEEVFVADIEAMTGGAHERADPTAQTGC